MTGQSPQERLGVVQVVVISATTYFVLDWLKSKPFGEFGAFGGLLIGLALVVGLIVYAFLSGWLAVRDVERHALREARRHGYESWAEYMAAEGDEFVRESWQGSALRERNKLSRRLKRLFTKQRTNQRS